MSTLSYDVQASYQARDARADVEGATTGGEQVILEQGVRRTIARKESFMFRPLVVAFTVIIGSAATAPAQTTPAPTDRTKASVFTAADLTAALAKLSEERPAASVRVFTLAPYNVNVERRLPREQGASLHETQAELFYVIDGTATLLTGGTLTSPTRNGTNLSGPGIENGTRQTFRKGDFLLVPSGIPHQFVDIKAPIQLMSIYLPDVPK